MSRLFPALDVIWAVRPDDEHLEILIAEVDIEGPTAVEERGDRLRLFFHTPTARGRAAIHLVALDPSLTCEPIDVPDEGWADRSQSALGAVRVGRIVVAPPWIDERVDGETALVTIRPSMGFGTAHHASTRLCLRLLQDLSVRGAHVLDVGTGSGVLAIAAVRLGASEAVGIDSDADALASARENVVANGVDDRVTLEPVDLGLLSSTTTYDIVLANLTGATIARCANQLAAHVAAGGSLICSGFETAEAAEVRNALAAAGLAASGEAQEEGWMAIGFGRT